MLVTVVVHAWVSWSTVDTITLVTLVAYTVACLLTKDCGDLVTGIGAACLTGTWVGDGGTDKSVPFEASVTFAVVVGLGNNVAVWDASGVGVTVVDRAWVDRLTSESVTKVASFARAVVVVLVSNQFRRATSLC